MKLLPLLLLSAHTIWATISPGINQFGFDISYALKSPSNMVVSPFSLSSSLSMCASGSASQTFVQMTDILHMPSNRGDMDKGFHTLFEQLSKTVSVTNSLWVQSGGLFSPLYLERVVTDYRGELRQVDFRKDPERAREEINEFVVKKTFGRILELFKPHQIQSLTTCVLINTIYLRAPFRSPFDVTHTRMRPFSISSSSTVQVPMMYQKSDFPIYKGTHFSVIEMPYASGSLVLWIILPDQIGLLPWSTVAEEIQAIRQGFKRYMVELHLPKFVVKSDLSLVSTLKKMGMTLPFSQGADFSLIVDNQSIAIDQVQHQSFFSVDEIGTEAAAGSGVGMVIKALPPSQPLPFVVDRPFHFLLVDKSSDTILFMGQLVNPGK